VRVEVVVRADPNAPRLLDSRTYWPAMNRALRQLSLLTETVWKRNAASGVFKKPTGRYLGSISSRPLPALLGLLGWSTAPRVRYAEWLEVGSRGRRIPQTHRSSKFLGYGLGALTQGEVERKAPEVLRRVFEAEAARIAGGRVS